MPSIITASTASNTALNFSADTSGVLEIRTGSSPTTAMTIDGSQNVGIGTSSPTALLHVNGTTNISSSHWLTFGGANTLFSSASLGLLIQTPSGNENTIFRNSSGTERMRITSDGNVGIGTSSISSQTRLAVASANQITDARGILSVNSTNAAATNLGGSISLGGENGQATSPYVFGSIAGRYEGSGYAGYLQFSTTNSGATVTERMRIDSSGNVLVGKTITGDTTEGNIIAPTYVFFTRNGFAPLNLRRLTSSGPIAEFYSGTSGTSSGSISVASTGMTYTGTNGITFTATQTASADANTLDDYEEGTFTPTVVLGITSPTYLKQLGTYTKIGNVVQIQISIELNGGTRNANGLRLGGLPFTAADFNGGVGLAYAYGNSNVVNSTSTNFPLPYIDANGTNVSFYNTIGGVFLGNDLVGANFRMDLTGTYRV